MNTRRLAIFAMLILGPAAVWISSAVSSGQALSDRSERHEPSATPEVELADSPGLGRVTIAVPPTNQSGDSASTETIKPRVIVNSKPIIETPVPRRKRSPIGGNLPREQSPTSRVGTASPEQVAAVRPMGESIGFQFVDESLPWFAEIDCVPAALPITCHDTHSGIDSSDGGASAGAAIDLAKVPLPQWFHQVDADGDGQIGLYEWRTSGRPVEAFRRIDRNGDGIVTANELRRVIVQTPGLRSANRPGVTIAGGVGGSPATRSRTSAKSSAGPAPAASAMTNPERPALAKTEAPKPQAKPVSLEVPPGTPLAATPVPLTGWSYWEERNAQNAARSQMGHANVLFLGDSISDWQFVRAGQPVSDMFFAPLGMANFAVAGATTSQVLWQVRAGQVAAVTPDVVVMLVGGNNLVMGQSPEDIATGIKAIVEGIQVQTPQTRIMLLGLLPHGATPDDPYRPLLTEVNARIAPLADGDKVRFVNFSQSYLQPDGTISPAIMPDYTHPSTLGYVIFAANLLPSLKAALGK